MDWGFTKVLDYDGTEYTAAYLAMVCRHCAQRYVEFFPNAKQENLFIGMIHAFGYMGIPRYVLTDNMKSVVLHRDFEGHPVWQKDYEAFMKTIGFPIKLCTIRTSINLNEEGVCMKLSDYLSRIVGNATYSSWVRCCTHINAAQHQRMKYNKRIQ